MLNLIGELLQLPGLLLKKTSGLGDECNKAEPPAASDQLDYSQELREEMAAPGLGGWSPNFAAMNSSLGTSNDLNSLAAPLCDAWGLHGNRYDYNPQGERVADQYLARMQKF